MCAVVLGNGSRFRMVLELNGVRTLLPSTGVSYTKPKMLAHTITVNVKFYTGNSCLYTFL